MEAKWLFGVQLEQIEVVVHPQSVIHSAVEYEDGAVIAQLGTPDMRLPIQYAPVLPKAETFIRGSVWIFLPFVTLRLSARIRIPSVGFPWHMMLPDGEEISQRFLMPQMKRQWQCFWTEKIAYPEITEMIEAAMEEVSYIAHPDLEQILETEQATYEYMGGRW